MCVFPFPILISILLGSIIYRLLYIGAFGYAITEATCRVCHLMTTERTDISMMENYVTTSEYF